MLATPHSRQRGLSRDVINPHDGHIRCDRNPIACGFILCFQASSRIVSSTISTPNEMVVAFIKSDPSWRVLNSPPSRSSRGGHRGVNRLRARRLAAALASCALVEKPKMGELQMDWLRSEDLKEEKNVSAPVTIIAGEGRTLPSLPNVSRGGCSRPFSLWTTICDNDPRGREPQFQKLSTREPLHRRPRPDCVPLLWPETYGHRRARTIPRCFLRPAGKWPSLR